MKAIVDASELFEAGAQSAEVVKPRDGPLHNPACFAQPATVRLTTSSNFSCNADGVQWTAIFVMVVASITLNDPRP